MPKTGAGKLMCIAQGRTQSFKLLDHVVTACGIDSADLLGARMDALLGQCVAHSELSAGLPTRLVIHREGSIWYLIDESGVELYVPLHDEAEVARCLEWEAYAAAIRHSSASLVLHAGAVTRHEGVVLLPNVSGAGKTTLTCALAACGWLPLTDDICPLLERNGELIATGCRRSFHLDRSTLAILSAKGVEVDGPIGGLEGYYRPRRWGEPAPVRCIIFPRYVENVATDFVPITQAECLGQLLTLQFTQELPSSNERRRTAARLAGQVPAFALTYSSLSDIFEVFEALAAELTTCSPAER
jgi:hypothetical protein